ncbi:hypothetical protein N7495_002806 [Penicillium taxi]|uniref:uncharacterized protein n=1 Tax=Penicillium taxi TaxID=168475 RepID=UPI002545620F|nr:uncharacterized protein N7495_002806 [Penicillium taxi]KAJ5902278.1 hypothetical protein N7495_002806 [Penicillium taxi]
MPPSQAPPSQAPPSQAPPSQAPPSQAPTSQPFDSFATAQPYVSSPITSPATPHQMQSAVPPPPPKIPQEYSSPPVGPYFPTQGPEPPNMGFYGFQPSVLMNFDPNPSQASSSALGYGSPSGWEHLGQNTDFDDAAWFPDRVHHHQETVHPNETAQSPPVYSTGMPSSPSGHVPQANAAQQAPVHPQGTFQSPVYSTGSPNHGMPSPPVGHISHVNTAQQAPVGAIYGSPHVQRHGSLSPVSSAPTQGVHTPPPARTDSVVSGISFSGQSERTESIDHVIDSLVQPPEKPFQPDFANSSPHPDPVAQNRSSTVEPLNIVQSPVQGIQPVHETLPAATSSPKTEDLVAKVSDPYEDLDPWFKSSLTRYVAMLRKEAVADSDEERYKIFTAFTAKEIKLREILYNIEPEPPLSVKVPPIHISEPSPVSRFSSSLSEESKVPIESGLIPVETEESPSLTDENQNMEDVDDAGSDYSSGGRPIIRKQAEGAQWHPDLSNLSREDNTGHSSQTSSMRLDEKAPEPITSSPPRPIYTPFQYTEGPQRGSDNLTFDRPAYQAYSDLRQASNGRVLASGPPSIAQTKSATLTVSPLPNDHDETFLGIIRHKSSAYRSNDCRNTTPLPLLPEALKMGRSGNLVEDLRAMVLTPLDKQSESSWHKTTRESIGKYPDDFSYIQNTNNDWEVATKAHRHKIDQDRTARQEDSEAQIDDLFNAKEIGYGDINTLEEDFRQSEARIQLDEERHEMDDFIKHVFNPLDERLNDEISALRKSYDSALSQLDRDRQRKSSPIEQCSPSITMKLINDIHGKLELRFQKRLEIALDCERRRKKAERRPMVFMGDKAGLIKLDGDFDRMEKRNILEAAKDHDYRANRLMDSFDDAILHGLGINQSLMDDLEAKIARLDATSIHASRLSNSEMEQILKSATKFAALLCADSEAILRGSGVAEMALNNADYNVSVAEARYADSEPDIFTRLEAEKKKEDTLLQRDLHSKLQSIQKAPREIDIAVQSLLRGLDDAISSPQSSHSPLELPLELRSATAPPIQSQSQGQSPPPKSQTPDLKTEHQERLRKALEDAKKRNAAKDDQ